MPLKVALREEKDMTPMVHVFPGDNLSVEWETTDGGFNTGWLLVLEEDVTIAGFPAEHVAYYRFFDVD